MQERREFCVVGPVELVGGGCVYLQHSFEPLSSTAGLVPDPGERFEVAGKTLFEPGEQDHLDVWIVLLQRRAPDPVQRAYAFQIRLVSATPWRWHWGFILTRRIDLAPPTTHPDTRYLLDIDDGTLI